MNLQDGDRRMRCLIVELSATGKTIPDSVFIDARDVDQEEPHTFASGWSADVYRGRYRGKRVALRRVRSAGLTEVRAKSRCCNLLTPFFRTCAERYCYGGRLSTGTFYLVWACILPVGPES